MKLDGMGVRFKNFFLRLNLTKHLTFQLKGADDLSVNRDDFQGSHTCLSRFAFLLKSD